MSRKKANSLVRVGLMAFLAVALASTAAADITNSVFGFFETFETNRYPSGGSIDGQYGWLAATSAYATIIADDTVTNYYKTSLPIPDAEHAYVLFLNAEEGGPLSNRFEQVSVTNVYVDMMIQMQPSDSEEGVFNTIAPDTGIQMAIFMNTNGHLVVFHSVFLSPGSPTNTMTALSHSPIQTGEWARLTIAMDYLSNLDEDAWRMFQVSLDGKAISNEYAYVDPTQFEGGDTNGTWFLCANLNTFPNYYMSSITFDGGALIDDFVVTNAPVTFEGALVKITASVGGGQGSIFPEGDVFLPPGGATNFLIVSSNWWFISDIEIDGVPIAVPPDLTVTNYVWEDVQSDGTIEAFFAPEKVNNVPKWWLHYFNTNWVADFEAASTNDFDTDNFTTDKEHIFSTDPTDADSYPRIIEVGVNEQGIPFIKWVCVGVDPDLPPFNIYVSTNLLMTTDVWQAANPPTSGPRQEGTNIWLQSTNVNMTLPAFYRLTATTNAP